MLPNPGRTKQTVWKTPPRQRVNGNHGNASKNSIIRSSIHAGAADRMVINIPISSLSWIFKQHCWEKGCLKIAPHDRIWRRVLRNTASRAHIHTRKERFLIFFPSAKKWMVEGHNRLRDSLWPSCTMIFQKESPKQEGPPFVGPARTAGSSGHMRAPHVTPTSEAVPAMTPRGGGEARVNSTPGRGCPVAAGPGRLSCPTFSFHYAVQQGQLIQVPLKYRSFSTQNQKAADLNCSLATFLVYLQK